MRAGGSRATRPVPLLPPPQAHAATPAGHLGLYTPSESDRDACGVGFVAELDRGPTRACVTDALEALERMAHRGACGCEANTGELDEGERGDE